MSQGLRTITPMAQHLTNRPPDERGGGFTVGGSFDVIVLGLVVVGTVVAVLLLWPSLVML